MEVQQVLRPACACWLATPLSFGPRADVKCGDAGTSICGKQTSRRIGEINGNWRDFTSLREIFRWFDGQVCCILKTVSLVLLLNTFRCHSPFLRKNFRKLSFLVNPCQPKAVAQAPEVTHNNLPRAQDVHMAFSRGVCQSPMDAKCGHIIAMSQALVSGGKWKRYDIL